MVIVREGHYIFLKTCKNKLSKSGDFYIFFRQDMVNFVYLKY